MTDRTEKYLRVEKAMTDDEKRVFLETFFAANPRQRGAHVADVLSMLDETDSHCGEVDELWESGSETGDRREMTRASLEGLFTTCWLAVYYARGCGTKPTWPEVLSMVERTRST